jgi:hypothetical protein
VPSVEPFTPSSVNNRRCRRDEMTYLLVFGVEVEGVGGVTNGFTL